MTLEWSKASVWRGLSSSWRQFILAADWRRELATRSAIPICLSPTAATNCWAQKSARLYNNCQDSGVGSDYGRGDLHNVIFNLSDIHYVFVSVFVIKKGPTPFSLLPQSLSSHYPRDEDYRRIAFLLQAQFLSFYYLWSQAGDSFPFWPNMLDCLFWWNWF